MNRDMGTVEYLVDLSCGIALGKGKVKDKEYQEQYPHNAQKEIPNIFSRFSQAPSADFDSDC